MWNRANQSKANTKETSYLKGAGGASRGDEESIESYRVKRKLQSYKENYERQSIGMCAMCKWSGMKWWNR